MAFKKIGTTYNEAANEWAEHYECDYEWEVANLPACNPGSSVKVLSTGKEYKVGTNGLWGGGGVSSWNDLTDKPFYEEMADVVLVDGEYTSGYDPDVGIPMILFECGGISETPNNFTVILDGVEYKNVQVAEFEGMGGAYGNLSFFNDMMGTDFPNTGEPFAGAFSSEQVMMYLFDTTTAQHKIKLVVSSRVVHAISQDFIHIPTFDLTEMGLPVIPFDGTVVTTNADNTELYNALKKGCVRLKYKQSVGESDSSFAAITYPVYTLDDDKCYCWFPYSWDMVIHIWVFHGLINDEMTSEISACLRKLAFAT